MKQIIITDWIPILTLIIAIITIPMMFLSGLSAVLFQKWITQPKPKPDTNQPKGIAHRITDWYLWIFKSFWFVPSGGVFIILILSASLYLTVNDPAPITRASVFTIALSVSLIVFCVSSIVIFFIYQMIDALARVTLKSHMALADAQMKTINNLWSLIELIRLLVKAVRGALPAATKAEAKTTLESLLSSLKKLLAGE